MQNIPDNQLDNFFKEALENPGMSFNPKAWSSMERNLDKALIRKLWKSRLKYLSLILLTISILTVTGYKIGENKAGASEARLNQEKVINKSTTKEEEKPNKQSTDPLIHNENKEQKSELNPSSKNLLNFKNKKDNLSDLSKDAARKESEELSSSPQESSHLPSGKKEILTSAKNDVNHKETAKNLQISSASQTNPLRDFTIKKKSLNTTSKQKYFHKENVLGSPLKDRKTSQKSLNSLGPTIQSLSKDIKEKDVEDSQTDNQEKSLNNKSTPSPDTEKSPNAAKVADKENTSLALNINEISTIGINDNVNKKSLSLNSSKEPLFNKLGEGYMASESHSNIYGLKPKGAFYSISSLIPIRLSFNKQETKDSTFNYVKKKENKIARPLVRISGLVSPDFSSYIDAKKLRSGYNTGFSLEIFPVKRLSVSAGILKSKKVYSTTADKYEPYPDFWKSKSLPKTIEGNCNVTDLQLNLRYYVLFTSKIKVFASTGMSSYLIRHEAYTYDYTTWKKTLKISKQNNHYFSIINLSTGMEHKLGNRFSFGIEPFIKIPVTGIGAGKIKLNSGGAFLSLTYLLFDK